MAYVLEASRRWYNAMRKPTALALRSSPCAAARLLCRFTKRVTYWYRSSSAPAMAKSTVRGMRCVKTGCAPQRPSAWRSGK